MVELHLVDSQFSVPVIFLAGLWLMCTHEVAKGVIEIFGALFAKYSLNPLVFNPIIFKLWSTMK